MTIEDDTIDFAAEADDLLTFADEGDEPAAPARVWKVLVVDDEPDVHRVTQLALGNAVIEGRSLQFEHAYSAAEGRTLVHAHPDAALILLDVVMETEHAGLELARYIREDAKNRHLRIVLRTGQPGQAPERTVIREYDINDYKSKTELTANKLFTLAYSSIRAYRDLLALERHRRGLELVVAATTDIYQCRNVRDLMRGVLTQITTIMQCDQDAAVVEVDAVATSRNSGARYNVLAGTGRYSASSSDPTQDAEQHLDDATAAYFERAVECGASYIDGNVYVGYYGSTTGGLSLIYLEGVDDCTDGQLALVELFSRNVRIAFENLELRREIDASQEHLIAMLGQVVETRSLETGNHVRRVALMMEFIARNLGLSVSEAELLRRASPMHDVGKVGIPDHILNKPGRLTDEEFEVMKTHVQKGYDLLSSSDRPLLQAASIIAHQHHEKFDGTGYPRGLAGDAIHLYGRIAAAADVYDALGSDRVYKKAWPEDRILDYFREQRGKHFDPQIVYVVLEHAAALRRIVTSNP